MSQETAQEAAMILKSAVFREAFEALDERIVEQWRSAKVMADRERLHLKQEALAEVRGELVHHIECEARREIREGVTDGRFQRLLKFIMHKE